jgi:glutamate/tyrosine decarboxylase-like PLP-dependent enzyme
MKAAQTSDASVQQLLADAAARARRYLSALPDRAVAPTATSVEALSRLGGALPESPRDASVVLAQLDEMVSPATMAMAGPRFFGFVIGGSLPVTVAANWLATAWDQNACLDAVTPGVAHIEQLALDWLLEVLHLPAGCAGAFVTGATVANMTALAAARHRVLANAGWNVEADGLFGAPPITVLVSQEVHPTVLKGLGVLGLGRNRVTRVPVDAQGRMRPDAMPVISGPTILILQAGNLNTGAFDPCDRIIAQAKAAGAWVHVDGAFGIWARATRDRSSLAAGCELADSWATDGHKWLNVPYDSGIAFVRDADALRAAMAVTAEYLPTSSPRRNPGDYTPELSRRARGVDVWAALATLGRSGVADMIEGCCRHARRFAEGLSAAGFEVLNDVVLNQVLVSFGTPERTREVIAAIQQDGTCWCGSTIWQGRTAMRISVCSWATRDEDVEKSLAAMIRLARG